MYKIMKEDIDKFDTSDYPENNQFGIPHANKKVLGVMKDECQGSIMKEFIGLRSKMYSIEIENQKPMKKAKGVKTYIVKNSITHEDYRNCLEQLQIIKREQCNIRSNLHTVRTVRENKIALSPNDDKRCIYPNNPYTLPWGHYKSIAMAHLKERLAQRRKALKRQKVIALGYYDSENSDRCRSNESVCGGGDDPSLKKRRLEMEGEMVAAAAARDLGVGQC